MIMTTVMNHEISDERIIMTGYPKISTIANAILAHINCISSPSILSWSKGLILEFRRFKSSLMRKDSCKNVLQWPELKAYTFLKELMARRESCKWPQIVVDS